MPLGKRQAGKDVPSSFSSPSVRVKDSYVELPRYIVSVQLWLRWSTSISRKTLDVGLADNGRRDIS